MINNQTTDEDGMQEIEKALKLKRDAKFARRVILEKAIPERNSPKNHMVNLYSHFA